MADQLIEIRDVTDRVYAALEGVAGIQARAAPPGGVITEEIVGEIRKSSAERKPVTTWRWWSSTPGAAIPSTSSSATRTSEWSCLRSFRLPTSEEIGTTSPSPVTTWTCRFYRIYDENGEPFQTENYFPFSEEGVSEGDLVFVIGNPGSTSRLQTVAQLEYRRDVRTRLWWTCSGPGVGASGILGEPS